MQQNLLKEITNETQNLKYFHILSAIYIASIITSLTVSARLLPLHIPWTHLTILLTGGTWTIPVTFFIQDITTEVYGYPKSRELVQIAIFILIGYVLYLKCTTYLPTPDVKNIDQSYNTIFNILPRHLFALLAAILTGNLINSYLLSKLKKYFKGKYLPLRFIGSTMVGEALLQFVGTTIAWFGSLHFGTQILPFIAFSYLYKVAFETIITPVNVFLCNWLKNAEGIDVYDENVNYNPLSFQSKKT